MAKLTHNVEWVSTTKYPANFSLSRQGIPYRSIQPNVGQDPVLDVTNTYWYSPNDQRSNVLNYIQNGLFPWNIQGWIKYNDGSNPTPTTGTGAGSTTNFSISWSTSSPLFGANLGFGQLVLTKGGFNLEGSGISFPFAIDTGATNQVMSLQFFTNAVTTNYNTGDLQVFIYDVTNSVLIPTSQQNISQFGGAFQCSWVSSSSTSYRLIMHFSTAVSGGYTMVFDNFSCGLQPILQGPYISQWISYSSEPTWGAVSSAPSLGTHTYKAAWRRNGNMMDITYELNQTGSGSAGSGVYLFPLPLIGVTIDYTNTVVDDASSMKGSVVGNGNIVSGASVGKISVLPYGTNQFALSLLLNSGTTAVEGYYGSSIFSLSLVETMSFTISVPIAQWTINATYLGINDPFCLSNNLATINTNGTTANTYNGYDGSPIIANTSLTYYDMSLPRALLPNEVYMLELYSKVDGNWIPANLASVASLFIQTFTGATEAGSTGTMYARTILLNKINSGQIRIIFPSVVQGASAWDSSTANTTSWASVIAATDGFTRWRVRIGKAAGVAEITPIVCADYYMSGTVTASTTPQTIIPNTKVEDTNSNFNSSTGVFTCTIPGRYQVSAFSTSSSGNASTALDVLLELQKNGGLAGANGNAPLIIISVVLSSGLGGKYNGSASIRLKAGDTISFSLYTNVGTVANCAFEVQIVSIGN
jgi:hypothetical protein